MVEIAIKNECWIDSMVELRLQMNSDFTSAKITTFDIQTNRMLFVVYMFDANDWTTFVWFCVTLQLKKKWQIKFKAFLRLKKSRSNLILFTFGYFGYTSVYFWVWSGLDNTTTSSKPSTFPLTLPMWVMVSLAKQMLKHVNKKNNANFIIISMFLSIFSWIQWLTSVPLTNCYSTMSNNTLYKNFSLIFHLNAYEFLFRLIKLFNYISFLNQIITKKNENTEFTYKWNNAN